MRIEVPTFASFSILSSDFSMSARTDGVGAVEEAKLLAATVIEGAQIGALLLLLGEDVNVL